MNSLNFASKKLINVFHEIKPFCKVSLHEPSFIGNEFNYVQDCIKSTFVSSVGEYVNKFESELAKYTGVKHVILTVNGTSALHASLYAAGIGALDEVLIPSLTFIATANAVSYCGAIPHFVDVECESMGVDPIKLRDYLSTVTYITDDGKCINKKSGRQIKALVPMHTFGHPVKIDEIASVSRDFNLILIEDAAEALGSRYKEAHVGSLGLAGILSFNGNKIITTGGGGAILTNDDYFARNLKHLTTTAKISHPWEFVHDEIAFNYRMPNLNAALGCAQLENLDFFIEKKRKIHQIYKELFANFEEVSLINEPKYAFSNYWLQAIRLKGEVVQYRDDILKYTNENGFMTRPVWTPIHLLKIYENCPKMDLTVTVNLARSIINIPSSPSLNFLKNE